MSFHADRVAHCNCHHRHSGRHAAARFKLGEGKGQGDFLQKQSEAVWERAELIHYGQQRVLFMETVSLIYTAAQMVECPDRKRLYEKLWNIQTEMRVLLPLVQSRG